MSTIVPILITPQAARDLLERFVCDNDELRELEGMLGAFNVFDALGVAGRELQHSNFLAWLLDPAESHGLGSLFLTPVLMDILRRVPTHRRKVNAVELDAVQLQGVEVRREWNHVDILIVARDPQFAIAIENKVFSGEHSDQLSRYKETIDREFNHIPVERRLFVFFSPGEADPSHEDWIPYSYARLYEVLANVRKARAGAIGDDVLVFLDHYLKLVRSRLMQTDDVRKLCEMIYKKHRQALDLIFDHAPSPEGELLQRIEHEISNDSRWHAWKRDRYNVYFVPRDWLSNLPAIGDGQNVQVNEWLYFCFEVLNGKLRRLMQVAPCADLGLRTTIIEKLREKYGVSMRKGGGLWTRLHSEVLLDGGTEEPPDSERSIVIVKSELDALLAKFDDLPEFVRSVEKQWEANGAPAR